MKQALDGRGIGVVMIAIAIAMSLVMGSVAEAQTTTTTANCSIAWDAYVQSTEPGALAAANFKLYLQKDGVQMAPVLNIPLTSTSITCANAKIVADGQYRANLHAVAADGTESDPSNGITWNVVTVKKPGFPKNLRVNP